MNLETLRALRCALDGEIERREAYQKRNRKSARTRVFIRRACDDCMKPFTPTNGRALRCPRCRGKKGRAR
jgi:Zn finger protein HypA/HybF involved in hydrogenase expression